VNPGADVIHSVKAYPTVLQILDPIDLGIIVLPKEHVPQALEDCGRKGIKGAVVISAGFREVGPEGVEREKHLLDICAKYGMRMVGPNCMGVVNTDPDVNMNATFAPTPPLRGNIAFLSQSGAMGVAILEHARELGIGFSMFMSMGNKADVDTLDLLEYWEDDPDTGVILMYLESFGDPRRFTPLARRIVRKKPILCVKSGRTVAGARAAVSHTGALAGLDVAVDALFEQTGILRVGTVEELFDVAMAFSSQPLPKGDRVAILTDAGGPAIMATDAVISSGMRMAELSEETKAALRGILHEEASVQNPVDLLGHCTEEHYRSALPLLLKDPGVDAVLALYVPPVIHDPIRMARAIFESAEGSDKPVLCCIMAREEVLGGIKDLGHHFPVYEFPESAVRALVYMLRYARYRERQVGTVPGFEVDRARADAIIAHALSENRNYLTTMEGFEVLDAYGIPSARWKLCRDADEAAAFAAECGFPVVVKLMSPSISHKSDYGGVVVDLRTGDEVRAAVKTILGRIEKADQKIVVDGFLVQQMVRGGKETILGVSTDAVFGPLVMFGMGGIYVEVLKDVAFRLAPITESDAADMMKSIRAWPLLTGVRGEHGVHLDAVQDALLRVSRLVTDFPQITEFDINPFIAHQDRAKCRAVDVRFRIRKS
ncbi:MAG: acetate--CoA ligase family protein, partial [Planctomycetes bacterium]|jgi:acetyltransferase|nr:acetate--CoA ligase family protein [Planctomycetota bacterium]